MLSVRWRKSSSAGTISVVVWCEVQFRFGVNELDKRTLRVNFYVM